MPDGYLFWLVLAVLTLCGAGSSFAAGYTVENLGIVTQIRGLNDAGQVTGLLPLTIQRRLSASSTRRGRVEEIQPL
jgi:hypothetical protein